MNLNREESPLLGGTTTLSSTSIAWLRTAVWDNARALYTSNRAKTLVLARSFVNPLKFSRPADQGEALMRVRSNWGTYKLFYGCVYALVLMVSATATQLGLVPGRRHAAACQCPMHWMARHVQTCARARALSFLVCVALAVHDSFIAATPPGALHDRRQLGVSVRAARRAHRREGGRL